MSKEIKNARKVIRELMEEDDGFKQSYVANVSCLIYDECHKVGHKISMYQTNEIAHKVIKLVFWK